MDALAGRVAIITGAGRGLGREYALLLAAEGAQVVVNDFEVPVNGRQEQGIESAAESVVSEIVAAGGGAVSDHSDVAETRSVECLLENALDSFGRVDILVNNAGILRDGPLIEMSDDDWDSVVRTHLRGHFVQTRGLARHWCNLHAKGEDVQASIINTSSASGLLGRPLQSNYGAAKAGIAAFTTIAAPELIEFGVRVNAVCPSGRTRMALSNLFPVGHAIEHNADTERLRLSIREPSDPTEFDVWNPANAAPLVAWLATEKCPATGAVFHINGGTISRMEGWRKERQIVKQSRWEIAEINDAASMIWP